MDYLLANIGNLALLSSFVAFGCITPSPQEAFIPTAVTRGPRALMMRPSFRVCRGQPGLSDLSAASIGRTSPRIMAAYNTPMDRQRGVQFRACDSSRQGGLNRCPRPSVTVRVPSRHDRVTGKYTSNVGHLSSTSPIAYPYLHQIRWYETVAMTRATWRS